MTSDLHREAREWLDSVTTGRSWPSHAVIPPRLVRDLLAENQRLAEQVKHQRDATIHERDAARATLDRVHALAERWHRLDTLLQARGPANITIRDAHTDLRNALGEDTQ